MIPLFLLALVKSASFIGAILNTLGFRTFFLDAVAPYRWLLIGDRMTLILAVEVASNRGRPFMARRHKGLFFWSAGAALLLPAAVSAAGTGAEVFPVHVKLQAAHQSVLPLGPWATLDATQVERYRALWPGLGEAYRPPFPVLGFGELLESLRAAARDVNAREVLMLTVQLDESGTVLNVDTQQYSDDQLVKRAVWIVVDTKFQPALCKGAACASRVPVVVRVPR